MKRKITAAVASGAICCAACAGVYAQETAASAEKAVTSDNETAASSYTQPAYDWQFTVETEFDTGEFGAGERTNTFYLPCTLTRFFERAEAGISVPLIYQDSGDVVFVGNAPNRSGRGGAGSSQGLGDIYLAGKYYFMDRSKTGDISISPAATLKLPTADEDEHLGTGEPDFGIGLENSVTLDERWSLYLDIYYTFIGDPPHIDYNNEFGVSVGAGYRLNRATEVGGYLRWRTALLDGNDDPAQLYFNVNHDLDTITAVFAGMGLGLSEGSPDFSLNAGFSLKF